MFAAATDENSLSELLQLEVDILEDGHISGLNGLLLGAAADAGLKGTCLLGEMPHIFAQLTFPRASLAVLRVFQSIAKLEIDLNPLEEQAREADEQLGILLERVEQAMSTKEMEEEEEGVAELKKLNRQDEKRIEVLFEEAKTDRSKAYELKSELDRLNVFSDYEERFLDLFRESGTEGES